MPEFAPLSTSEENTSPSSETQAFLAECHDRIMQKPTILQAIKEKRSYYWNTVMLLCGNELKKSIDPLGDDAKEYLALSVATALRQQGVSIKSPRGEFIDPSDPTIALERRRWYKRTHESRGFNNNPNLSEAEEVFIAAKVNDICGRIDSGEFKLSTSHGLIVSIGKHLQGLEGTGAFESDRFYVLRDTIDSRVCAHCNTKGLVLKPRSHRRSSDPKTAASEMSSSTDSVTAPNFTPLSSEDNDEDDANNNFASIGSPAGLTQAKPGSEEKVLMMAARYAAGRPIFPHGDRTRHGPTDAQEKEIATQRNEREAREMRDKLEAAMG